MKSYLASILIVTILCSCNRNKSLSNTVNPLNTVQQVSSNIPLYKKIPNKILEIPPNFILPMPSYCSPKITQRNKPHISVISESEAKLIYSYIR